MKLHGRNLTTETKGADVALLQRELRQLNFTIPDNEASRSFFGPGTLKAVQEFQRQKALDSNGVVDERTAAAMSAEVAARQRRFVRGTVTHEGGAPAPGLNVFAFDRDLRREQPLGQAATDTNGNYEITYTARQFRRAEKLSADLVVRVSGRDGRALLSSEVIFNAELAETVDFILDGTGARVSEFERYRTELHPLLEEVQPSALDERDITFLEGETGIEGLHLAYFAIAHRHADKTKVFAEAFYGLFRQDLPTHLPALLFHPPTQLRRALELSIEDNIIPSRLSDEVSRILAALRRQAGQVILRESEGGAAAVPRLLRAAGLSTRQQESFLNSYLEHDGTIEEFWRSLKATPLGSKVEALQATLQLGLLTGNNAPLVEALHAKGVRSVRDLPRLGRDGLRQLILGSNDVLAAIDAAEGETNEQRAARFAEGMLEVLRATAPTAFVRAAYEDSSDGVRRDVARVLENAPELELRDADVERFLSENPGALANVADHDPVRRRLKRIQRVLRIAPDAEHTEVLMAEGLDSAQAIASMSSDSFAEQFGARLGGEAQARSYHSKAGRVTDAVTGIVGSITQNLLDVRPGAIGPVPDSVKQLPNFTTLFGSQSFCSCEHCGSVLSPAAYLVDLLQFINPKSGQKPITELRRRRPDIEHIPLTCENTNTPLPYVDLINEVLEFYVANGEITQEAARDTKGMTAAELSVNPQYVIDRAYSTLADVVYPPLLPFHSPLTVARLYLEKLGSSRHELMETFQREGRPTAEDADLEFLNLSAFEREILTNATNKPLAEFYGLSAAQDPSDLDEIKTAEFLRMTGITYEELIELLATRFLNPDGNIELEDDENPSRCDLEKTTLKNLRPQFWRRAHRFIRLRRSLAWPARDLDRAFGALQETRMTLGFLRKLAAIEKLRKHLPVPTPVLLSFWGDLDTEGPASLYARLFLSKAVLNPPVQAFRVFELEDSDAPLAENESTILAALHLNATDLEALKQRLDLLPDQTLSLPLLSSLHRYVALARAVRLSIKEFLTLLTLTGENPFVRGNPLPTLQFVELVRRVKESGFTVGHLGYLYLSETPNPFAPTDAAVRALFKSLRDGLRKITDGAPQLSGSTKADLKAALLLVLDEGLLDDAEAIVEKPAALDASDLLFIGEHFTFLDVAEANALGIDPTPESRHTRLLAGILAYVRRRDLVLQVLGQSLGVESQMVGTLVERVLVSRSEPAPRKAIRDFLKLADLPDEAFDDTEFRKGHLRLHKAALLVSKFRIGKRELVYLHEHGPDFGGLDLNSLPLEPADFNAEQFSHWLRVSRYAEFAHGEPQSDSALIDVFEATLPPQENPREEAIKRLKLSTGWDSAEVDFLAGPEGFDLDAADFRNEDRLVTVQRCIRLSHRLGVSCAQLFRWASEEPDAKVANELVSAAKAKYTDEQWPAVAKPLNDRLRESRKDALIAYTLDRTKLDDSNQIFERFLIDVEMSACMKTSRIKQAISSVQLFIQRCLMNLEGSVSPSTIDAGQWEWMKNYRVWEANRKVFLYPENWIEPELRDGKSPIFRDLEAELMQGDLDGYTAEQAFLHYLEGLDRVAHLEPCGLYVQEASAGGEEVVHVFGRTLTTPHSYYYRRFIGGRTWTPWEPVDLDIEGDHLMPIVHDRRVYLFWLRFEQMQNKSQEFPDGFISSYEHYKWRAEHYRWRGQHKTWQEAQDIWKALEASFLYINKRVDPPPINIAHEKDAFGESHPKFLEDEPKEPTEPAFSNPPPILHWEIKLGWGEYHRGRWTAKRTSPDFLVSPMVTKTLGEFTESLTIGDLALEEFKDYVESSTEAIALAYLPEESQHLMRTEVDSGHLRFRLYRRYKERFVVIKYLTSLERYESLGSFRLACGSKVDAQGVKGELEQLESLDYDSFRQPDGTVNAAMSFRHLEGPGLTFTNDAISRDILKESNTGRPYTLLPEHQHYEFRLTPPYQDFFYQDREKTYYARYQSNLDVLKNPSFTALGTSFQPHDALAVPFKQRILTTPSNGQRRSGAKRIVVQNPPQEVGAGPGSEEERAATPIEDNSLARSLARTGAVSDSKVAELTSGLKGFGDLVATGPETGIRFHTFFHPYVCDFTERLYRGGMPALLSRETQMQIAQEAPPGRIFEQRYQPTDKVAKPYPRESVDFAGGAYSLYNWELFFHGPMLVALSLTKNQRFADALRWFHFVFNPTTGSTLDSPGRYWKTLPFFLNSDPEKDQIRELLLTLAERGPGWQEIEHQIAEWLDNPFNPHLIARLRLTAYQKNVVMKYVDTLIAWGDQLFNRDTLESINEATLLYVLAYNILGPRPQTIPKEQPDAKTYKDLEDELEAFSNALVEVENAVPNFSLMPEISWASSARTMTLSQRTMLNAGATLGGGDGGPTAGPPSARGPVAPPTFSAGPEFTFRPGPSLSQGLSAVRSLYFCVPQNEQLLRYWDTVEDRLFKIRHCMNIDGVVRELPLFEPPIDPALLVRAVAAGLDIGSVLNDLFAPLPHYRFSFMLQKAQELCGDLKSLSGALLSALEKRDVEDLSNLRAMHETSLLREVREVRRQQVAEAKSSVEALNKTFEATQHRRTYYENLLSQGLIAEEHEHIEKSQEANSLQSRAQSLYLAAQHLSGIPDFEAGTAGWSSPVATFKLGGSLLSSAASQFAKYFESLSGDLKFQGEMSSIVGGHRRRAQDWAFQVSSAQKEIAQISKQIVAAEIRQAIAEKELENHERQIENSATVQEFLRSKYTNEELYGWMIAQVAQVYFQTYKLATDLAKRAERALRFELGFEEGSYINSAYWDSLKKGLLAGEKLEYDLRRLEIAYLEKNRREFELSKHVSLALLNPLAVVTLRETGRCDFDVPEEIFDLDFPGHYFRRIKSVSLTLPCVVGPYTTISCTLRLTKNSIRINTTNGDNGYPHNRDAEENLVEDSRFVENHISVNAIAVSNAQNDSGVFELNFRDERYLPFEGAGVVSAWSLELFNDPANGDFGKALRQFDYGTISDAIIHIKYTAREDAGPFKDGAIDNLREYFSRNGTTPSVRLFNLRQEFPGQWHRFLNPTNPAEGNVFEFEMSAGLFPLRDLGKTLKINKVELLARCTDAGVYTVQLNPTQPPPPDADAIPLTKAAQYGGLHFGQRALSAAPIEVLSTGTPLRWILKMTRPGGGSLERDEITKTMEVEDVMLVVSYEW